MLHTDPFALLSSLERQFDGPAQERALARNGWLPALDVVAGEHEIKIIMDAPGVSREDLTVEFHDGQLLIAGERKPVDVSGSSAQRIERGWGRWSRTLRLRAGLDGDQIRADLTDGVLRVSIPVAEAAKPKRVAIGAGDDPGAGTREIGATT